MLLAKTDCPFCKVNWANLDIVDRNTTGSIVAIKPLNPITPGHVIVIHGQHKMNATEDPDQAGFLMNFAAKYVRKQGFEANIIASIGALAAGQTVLHSCLHVIPRHVGDELPLPWTRQKAEPVKAKA